MSISRLKSIELVMKPFILFGMIINCCLTSIVTGNSHSPEHSIIRTQVDSALDALNVGDIARSTAILHNFLLQAPNDVDANQFLGSIYVQLKEHQKGSIYLSKAVEFSNWQQAHIIANYIESLRGANFLVDAWNVCVKAVEIHPSSEHILFNAGIVARDRKEYSSAIGLFQRTVTLNPSRYSAWDEGADAMINNIQLEAAEIFLEEANKTFPRNTALMSKLAFCKHKQKKLKEAEALLSDALLLEPDSYLMNGNMGAIMQTMGRSEEARNFYKKCMPFKAGDYGLRNNYGALLGEMGLKEEELYWLKKSLEIEPSEHVLFNLGGYYQDEGLIDIAREYFNRAILVSEKSSLLKLRVMLMLYPVCSSWEVMIGQRNLMEASLLQVLADPIAPQKHHIDSSLNRIHFYLVYHGLNDRYMQELIIRAYNKHLEGLFYLKAELQLQNGGSFLSELQTELLPKRQQHLQISTQQTLTGTSLMNEDKISRKVRVGFMSMFFSIFEPHGMLLDGVMKNLPRSHFEVLAMPIVRNDGMPLSPSFIESCDKVVNIPQSNIAVSQNNLTLKKL
jgi:Tfp pilus assembly protein PilF